MISVPEGVLEAVAGEPAAGLPTLDGLPNDAGADADAVTILLLPALTL